MHGCKYIIWAMLIITSWAFGQPPTVAQTVVREKLCPFSQLIVPANSSNDSLETTIVHRTGPNPDETLVMPPEKDRIVSVKNPIDRSFEGSTVIVHGGHPIGRGAEANVTLALALVPSEGKPNLPGRKVVVSRTPRLDVSMDPHNIKAREERRENENNAFDALEQSKNPAKQFVMRPLAIEGEEQFLPYHPKDLESLVSEFPQLAFDKQVALLSELSSALALMHSLGWVHRDLKLSNIRVNGKSLDKGHLIVADLGLTAPVNYVEAGMYGSYGYMPWQQMGGGEVKPFFDVYAFGRNLDELLVGSSIGDLAKKDDDFNLPEFHHTYARKAGTKTLSRGLRFSSYTTNLKAGKRVDSRQELLSTIAMLAQLDNPVIHDGQQVKTYMDGLAHVKKGKERLYYEQYLQEPLDSLPIKDLALLIGRDPSGLGKRYLQGHLRMSDEKKAAIGQLFNKWIENKNYESSEHQLAVSNTILPIVEREFAEKWNKPPSLVSKVFNSFSEMGKRALGRAR